MRIDRDLSFPMLEEWLDNRVWQAQLAPIRHLGRQAKTAKRRQARTRLTKEHPPTGADARP